MSKKIKFLLTAFLSVMVLFGVLLPSAAYAATERPDTGALSIHKLQYHTETAPVINNNGLALSAPPAGTSALPGVTFKVYKVADDATATTIESITLFAFFVELKEKKQSRWLFQSQICRIWAS